MVVLYGSLVFVLWRLGLFDVDAARSDARVIAATVALTGGLLTASLTFVGVLLKHALDARNLRLAEEAEARLKLETSIRAVELLTGPQGAPASQSTQAGSLFVLANLGQLDFALALLHELWPRREVTITAGMQIVDLALRSSDPWLQINAAHRVLASADRLPDAEGTRFEFPSCADLDWPVHATFQARLTLAETLLAVLASRPLADWTDGALDWFTAEFHLIRQTDPNETIKALTILALHALLHSGRYAPGVKLHVGETPLQVDELLPVVDDLESTAWNLVPDEALTSIKAIRAPA